jgi:hypothetical protein
VSVDPLPADFGVAALEEGLRHAVYKRRFTSNSRLSSATLPANTLARYVRVQLERPNYMHFAQCEVIGVYGTASTIGCVTSVTCGRSVTGAVMAALTDEE